MGYRPGAKRRSYIPKAGSEKGRPLGISNLEDKIVEAAVKRTLEPIYEAVFEDSSYGYRPGLSVAVELLLLERRLPSSTNTTIVFISRTESVFRCRGGFGECITPGSDTDEGFGARGTGRCERADDQPMATVVARDGCAEPILGGGARSLSHSGRREELAACVAPGF